MITIGIPVRNQLSYLQRSLDSVLNCCSISSQIVIVDDVSDIETKNWLKGFTSLHENVTLIRNSFREGFAYNANLILDEAKGEVVILLNSDIVVTPCWDKLLFSAFANKSVALAGPSTSCAHTPQALMECRFGRFDLSDEEIGRQAKKIASMYSNQREYLKHLGGFCYAISYSAFEDIGYFDERFGLGPFEENDYSDRASKKGYKSVWVKDSYVHHFGGVSFNELGMKKYKQLMSKAHELYEAKRNGSIEPDWIRRDGKGKLEVLTDLV